jgi:hypothetical protein
MVAAQPSHTTPLLSTTFHTCIASHK